MLFKTANCQKVRMWNFLKAVGLNEQLMAREVHEGDKLAHYARACTLTALRKGAGYCFLGDPFLGQLASTFATQLVLEGSKRRVPNKKKPPAEEAGLPLSRYNRNSNAIRGLRGAFTFLEICLACR